MTIHEVLHSWYQMILGTNESYFAWMDEGFASFAQNTVTTNEDTPADITLLVTWYDF